jgi:hypothetical protein
MADKKALLSRLYDAISRQDVDGVLSVMHPDIDWPNTIEGGRVVGLEAMRAYWTRQFGIIRPQTGMIDFEELPDGSVRTRLIYTRYALDGALWDDQLEQNLFRFQDGLIIFGDWI